MNILNKLKNNSDILFLSCVTFFLIFKTGFVSDDFYVAFSTKNNWAGLGGLEASPLLYFSHWIAFSNIPFGGQSFAEILKASYGVFALNSFFVFFKKYRSRQVALWAALALVFFPNKDGSTFFFIGQHTMMSLSLYLFAFDQALKNKMSYAIILGFCGSFISYGSTPIALGLASLFILQKKYNKALWFALPNFIYIGYYFFVTKILIQGIQRINFDINFVTLLKNLVIQILSSIDAVLGISFIIKAFLTFKEAGLFGLLLSLSIWFFSLQLLKKEKETPKKGRSVIECKNVSKALFVMTFLTLCMFALTGLYPQIAFNLGNRVTLIPTFLFIWLFSNYINNNYKIIKIMFLITIIFGVGTSIHWRSFTNLQNEVILKLRENPKLPKIESTAIIFTQGMRYSKLGLFDHLEGASESWVTQGYFLAATGQKMNVMPISRYFAIKNNKIINHKYKTYQYLNKNLYLVDLNKNLIKKTTIQELVEKIKQSPIDKRHWIQFLQNKIINEITLKIYPRSKYIFEK